MRKLLLIPYCIVAVVVLIIVYVLRPIYLVRWEQLHSARLGHFAANTELYCCARDASINTPNISYIDLFYTLGHICNKQLYIMWKRELNIAPYGTGRVLHCMTRLIKIFQTIIPSLSVHLINTPQDDRDVHNIVDSSPVHLSFTPEEEARGDKWLKAHNIPTNSKIVLLTVRDDAYLSTINPGADWKYHNYRDCDVNNFVLAADELASRGYYVIRLGHHVKDNLKSNHPMVIDYAKNGMRDDFMDIYLSSICTFIISTATGGDAPAVWCFKKPFVQVDHVPIGILHTYFKHTLLLTKHHISIQSNRELSLSEIFSNNVDLCMKTSCYDTKGVKLVENTPDEILDIVVEMVERLEGSWHSEVNDKHLQKKFWEIFSADDINLDNKPLHGKIKGKFGAKFLRDNANWLK